MGEGMRAAEKAFCNGLFQHPRLDSDSWPSRPRKDVGAAIKLQARSAASLAGTCRWVDTWQGDVSCESMWSIRNRTVPYCENPTRPWRIRLENSGLSPATFAVE